MSVTLWSTVAISASIFCTISQSVSIDMAIIFSFPFLAFLVIVKPHAPELTTTVVICLLSSIRVPFRKRGGKKRRPGECLPAPSPHYHREGVRGDNPAKYFDAIAKNLLIRSGHRKQRGLLFSFRSPHFMLSLPLDLHRAPLLCKELLQVRELVLHVRDMHRLHELPLEQRIRGDFDELDPPSALVRLAPLVPVQERHARTVSGCVAHGIDLVEGTVREHAERHGRF